MSNNKVDIEFKPQKGKNCVIIGVNSRSDYDNCVLLGPDLEATKHNQIIIGNKENSRSGDITDEQVSDLMELIKASLGLTIS